jgi:hypothetical protein
MAPPQSDPRIAVLQAQLAQERAERIRSEAREDKKIDALAVFNSINLDVEKKTTSLRLAATAIGTAYSVAARRHKDALAAMRDIQAMDTQLMFSVLTVLTSGALSWATALVRLQGEVQAVGRMEGIAAIEALRAQVPRDYQSAMVALTQRLKDQLSRNVSVRELLTTVLEDTAAAGIGELFGSMGPYFDAPPATVPASQDPQEFQNGLEKQVDALKLKALDFLGRMITKIKNTHGAAWDKYDDSEFQTAYQDWKKEVNGLADQKDLPADPNRMADDLERTIWAVWVPRLRTRTKPKEKPDNRTYRGDSFDFRGGEVDVYARVYEPVDDRFVALGIETQEQTDLPKQEEDKLLIAWGEKYLRNLQPWVPMASAH